MSTCVISSPLLTNSGYGRRSLDTVRGIIKSFPNLDIKLLPLSWGNTPTNLIDLEDPINNDIKSRLVFDNKLQSKPDIFIQITIANECNPIGNYNILITAGIETDRVSPEWIIGANKMDLILVSSEHSKNTFMNTAYNQVVDGKVVSTLKLTKPIDVLFEGVNTTLFNKLNSKLVELDKMDSIDNDFNFLFVGSWLNGTFGEDRKNVTGLIKTFLETFKHKDNTKAPGLILKTHGANASEIDYSRISKIINEIKQSVQNQYPDFKLPNLYLIHGEFSDEEMNKLYNHKKVKCMISFTKGEGYNRTPLEFMTTKKPIIISNWSGHLDYLSVQGTCLLRGNLTQVHPSVVWNGILTKESKWFTVDYDYAKETMIDVWTHYDKHFNNARRNNVKEFTIEKMNEKVKNLFDKYIPKHLMANHIVLDL